MKAFQNVLLYFIFYIFSFDCLAGQSVLRIAITGPFTGSSAPMGISMRDGAKLAIQEINEQGGLEIGNEKFKIEIFERDDEGKNEKGALVARELSEIPDINAVIGTANTGVAIAGDTYYQKAKMIRIITPATGTAAMSQWSKASLADLYIFRFAANDSIQAAMILEEVIQKMALKKIALIHDVTNYGISGRDDILKQLNNYPHVELVTIERFNIGDKDLKNQIKSIKDSKAQALLLWGIGPEAAAVANEMHRIGLNIPLIGGWTLSMASYLDNAGRNAEGTFMPQSFIENSNSKRAGAFVKKYYETYKVDRIPSPMSAAEGYDAVKILAAAFQQAKSQDPIKVKEALENLENAVAGVITTWIKPYSKWDPQKPQTHEAFRPQEVVMAVVKDGKISFLYDEDREKLHEQVLKTKDTAPTT